MLFEVCSRWTPISTSLDGDRVGGELPLLSVPQLMERAQQGTLAVSTRVAEEVLVLWVKSYWNIEISSPLSIPKFARACSRRDLVAYYSPHTFAFCGLTGDKVKRAATAHPPPAQRNNELATPHCLQPWAPSSTTASTARPCRTFCQVCAALPWAAGVI